MDKDLNPFGIAVRESRDSDLNPQSNAIIVGLDVTGSMGMIADALARKGLGTMVEEILAKFKNGERDTAEFWIELGGRFIHIRYFAVRHDGRYLGCPEVSQDVTAIRAMEGQQRLLDWK